MTIVTAFLWIAPKLAAVAILAGAFALGFSLVGSDQDLLVDSDTPRR